MLPILVAGCGLIDGKFYDVTLESRYEATVWVTVDRGVSFGEETATDLASAVILDPRESDMIIVLAYKNYDYYQFFVHEESFDGPLLSKLEFTYGDLKELGWHVVLEP